MPSDPLLSAYADHTAASPTDLTRLRANIRARGAERQRSALPVWLGAGALALAGLLAVTVVGLDTEPAPIVASFDGTAMQATEVAPGVVLTAQGTGTLSGTEQAPRLAWSAGTVDVSVEPGAGLDVQVLTDEALVQVVGTVFQVERGPLGTRVGVTRGKVAVTCTDGSAHSLTEGTTALCWPTSATGLLGRAQALRTGGAAPEAVLNTVARGLDSSPDPTIRTELSALRVALLAEGPHPEEAIEAAAEHLSLQETGRRAEVARIGAALGYAASGCDGAIPFIADLPPEEVSASALSMCQTGGGNAEPR